MATIKPAVVSIIINSSYVLISTTPSTRLEAGGERPPSCLGKYIILWVPGTHLPGVKLTICLLMYTIYLHIIKKKGDESYERIFL